MKGIQLSNKTSVDALSGELRNKIYNMESDIENLKENGIPSESSITLNNTLNSDSTSSALTAAKGKELNDKINVKTLAFININEYVHLVPNRTESRNQWNWTEAFKQAARDGINQGKYIQLNKEMYVIKDSFTNLVTSKGKIHWKGLHSRVDFDNTTPNKAMIDLLPNTSHSTFENITFFDVSKYTSVAVRISAYPQASGEPNWKNRFVGCEFYDFKIGVNFTTNGNVMNGGLQDWSSENLFLHCKIRNCHIGVLNQNLQALNNSFIQTDIENDEPGEQFTLIRDEAGGGMYFSHCSLIGRGRVFEWCYPQGGVNLFPAGNLYIHNCRFEIRGGYIGQIFYQDPSGSYNQAVSMHIEVSECKFICYGQTLDLLKYTGRLTAIFKDLSVTNGVLKIKNVPTEGRSATVSGGSLGEVKVLNCTNIIYEIDTSDTSYGTVNTRLTNKVQIENISDPNGTWEYDQWWFASLKNYSVQNLSYGLSLGKTYKLYFNDELPSYGFKDLAFKVPKNCKLLKFGYFKQPVRFSENTSFQLYMIKDQQYWVSSADYDETTDGHLVAEITNTTNKAGLFEVPIQVTSNIFGQDLTSGKPSIWTEGRLYVRFSNGSNNGGGLLYVEYM